MITVEARQMLLCCNLLLLLLLFLLMMRDRMLCRLLADAARRELGHLIALEYLRDEKSDAIARAASVVEPESEG